MGTMTGGVTLMHLFGYLAESPLVANLFERLARAGQAFAFFPAETLSHPLVLYRFDLILG